MTPADSWIDGLAEGVVLVAGERVVRINTAAGRILGAEPEWAKGKRLITVVRDHRLERVWSHGEVAEVTLAERVIEATPLPGGLSLRDATEARRAREDATSLLAVLSHELRTPMTTVRATLDALDFDDLTPAERSRLLERAIGEADRVVRLLGDLTVDVAPPRERSVALSSVVSRAAPILAQTLEERGVRLRQEPGATVVWADPDKLLQVLLNLIENAALHGPADAEVEVGARPSGSWVELFVRDQGEALTDAPPALTGSLERHPDSKSREHGLGLHVVRSIAEGWGGKAWWRARPHGNREGNEFGVLIPGSRDAARFQA